MRSRIPEASVQGALQVSIERPPHEQSELVESSVSDEALSGTMKVQAPRSNARRPRTCSHRGESAQERARSAEGLDRQTVGVLLGQWQAGEIRLARGWRECHDLTREQLEDVYQEAVVTLLDRAALNDRYESEEHLRNSLRKAVRQRALNVHRDARTRRQILASGSHQLPQADDVGVQHTPEHAVISGEDRLLVTEFLAELTVVERRVFWLMADGMSYRAIATALAIPTNQARNASRACERKRGRFQLLYDTGRLCGYRGVTIRALKAGQQTSEQLVAQAMAHLVHCQHCRAEHHISAARLRDRFEGQAVVLLPGLAGRLGWLARIGVRSQLLMHRVAESQLAGEGVRERAAALLAASGAASKLAAGAVGAVLLAGGVIGATKAIEQTHPAHAGQRSAHATPSRPAQPMSHTTGALSRTKRRSGRSQPGRVVPRGRRRVGGLGHIVPVRARHERSSRLGKMDGFAYLGVPAREASAPAANSSRTGGPFSP